MDSRSVRRQRRGGAAVGTNDCGIREPVRPVEARRDLVEAKGRIVDRIVRYIAAMAVQLDPNARSQRNVV